METGRARPAERRRHPRHLRPARLSAEPVARGLRDQDAEAPEHRRDAASGLARHRLCRRRLGRRARRRAGRAAGYRPRPGERGRGRDPGVRRRRPRPSTLRRGLGVSAPDPRLARAARPARDRGPLLWRDRGVPARGCRLHRRQHGHRRDPARQRPRDRRRADALLDPPLCQSACARAAGQARADRAPGAAAALGARCAPAGDARGQRAGRPARGGDRRAALDARADHGAAARQPGFRGESRSAARAICPR